MEPNNDKSYIRVHKTTVIVAVLVVGALLAGWLLGRGDNKTRDTGSTTPSTSQPTSTELSKGAVSELVSYQLPDAWREQACEGNEAVFVVPNGTSANCSSNPVSAVKLSVDPGNNTDCNQLQNQTDVKKHTCISVFINGRKTLKASTQYLASSSYKQDTTIESYYFDSGSGVVKAEYIYTTDNKFQAGFDQLANSLKTK